MQATSTGNEYFKKNTRKEKSQFIYIPCILEDTDTTNRKAVTTLYDVVLILALYHTPLHF